MILFMKRKMLLWVYAFLIHLNQFHILEKYASILLISYFYWFLLCSLLWSDFWFVSMVSVILTSILLFYFFMSFLFIFFFNCVSFQLCICKQITFLLLQCISCWLYTVSCQWQQARVIHEVSILSIESIAKAGFCSFY